MLPPDGGDLTVAGVRALRTALVAAGFKFFPEITGQKRSTKAVGTWVGKCGLFDPSADYRNQYGSLLNTALYLDCLFAIDVDVDDPQWVEHILVAMVQHLGEPACLRHRAGSPRVLALYRSADPQALYAARKGSDGAVEVFAGADAKITAFGLHTNKVTGERTRLQWVDVPGNVRKVDLPAITIPQRDSFLDALTDFLGDDVRSIERQPHDPTAAPTLVSDVTELCRAFVMIPNIGPMAWPEWNRLGMALYAGSGGDPAGLKAFADWTAGNRHTAHRDCAERWQAYAGSPPTRIGPGAVFKAAQAGGYHPPRRVMTDEEEIAWRRQKWARQKLR